MKRRNGFVTNSSSSSFIINKKEISRGNLLEILLEIANETNRVYGDNEEFGWDDVTGTCVAWNYHIREADHNYPYYGPECRIYEEHYVIDNEESVKYNWDVISEVLDKHHIKWEKGWDE